LRSRTLKQLAADRDIGIDRFPSDFMFQVNAAEFANWKSQNVTSNPSAVIGLRKQPYAFTELAALIDHLKRAFGDPPYWERDWFCPERRRCD
jgi:hypothetical protein